MNPAVRKIEEHDQVKYKSLDELSYSVLDNGYVALYVNKQYEGDIEVWCDAENDERDYVCINYEMVYLDQLKRL